MGGRAGSYLDLRFPVAVTLNRWCCMTGPIRATRLPAVHLTFSDGTSVPVPALDNAGQATSIGSRHRHHGACG